MSRRLARGYTLIEIVVAFAILAFGLTLLLGTLSGATRQVRAAGEAGRAALHAQSLLDVHGRTPRLGTLSGELEDGRYRWQLEVTAWDDPALSRGSLPPAANAPRPVRLELRVAWDRGGGAQELRVASLRQVLPLQQGVSRP